MADTQIKYDVPSGMQDGNVSSLRSAGATVAPAAYKRTSWGAIIAGTTVVLATQILLSMLGIAIGASTIDPTAEQNPASGLGTGAIIWFAVSTLLALFAGGWVAGRLAGVPIRTDSLLHGLLTWGLSTLVTFYLLTTAIGGLLGGTARVLGGTLSTATQSAASAGAGQPQIVGQARQALDQAENKVGQLRQQAQSNAPEIEQRAREAGQSAASGTSKAAAGTFVILLLGALAASIGGARATPRDLSAARR